MESRQGNFDADQNVKYFDSLAHNSAWLTSPAKESREPMIGGRVNVPFGTAGGAVQALLVSLSGSLSSA